MLLGGRQSYKANYTNSSSTRTPHSSLQPRKPPGIRVETMHVTSGAVVFIVPNHRAMTDAISGMLVEAYGNLDDGIRVLGDQPILDHFTWLGRDSFILVVYVEKGRELLRSVMRDALVELYDFMTRTEWMTASFTVMQGKEEVGTGRVGML